MSGFTTADGWDFLHKGGHSVDQSGGAISVTYTSKHTTLGDIWGPHASTLAYDEYDDTLTFLDSDFGATLYRAEGTVIDADCDPSW